MAEAQNVKVLMSSARQGECRSCGADVTWYKTKAGKWTPFNGTPKPETQPGLMDGEAIYGVIPAAANHFTTCPDAATWRKRR